MKKLKVYVAAPWFNKGQSERERFVVKQLRSLDFLDVFSPRDSSLVKPDDSYEKREIGFNKNKDEISNSDFIISITNEKDMGTLFDTGVASAYGKPIIYFAEELYGSFNLMLAMSAVGIITSRENFIKDLLEIVIGNMLGKKFVYEGEIE